MEKQTNCNSRIKRVKPIRLCSVIKSIDSLRKQRQASFSKHKAVGDLIKDKKTKETIIRIYNNLRNQKEPESFEKDEINSVNLFGAIIQNKGFDSLIFPLIERFSEAKQVFTYPIPMNTEDRSKYPKANALFNREYGIVDNSNFIRIQALEIILSVLDFRRFRDETPFILSYLNENISKFESVSKNLSHSIENQEVVKRSEYFLLYNIRYLYSIYRNSASFREETVADILKAIVQAKKDFNLNSDILFLKVLLENKNLRKILLENDGVKSNINTYFFSVSGSLCGLLNSVRNSEQRNLIQNSIIGSIADQKFDSQSLKVLDYLLNEIENEYKTNVAFSEEELIKYLDKIPYLVFNPWLKASSGKFTFIKLFRQNDNPVFRDAISLLNEMSKSRRFRKKAIMQLIESVSEKIPEEKLADFYSCLMVFINKYEKIDSSMLKIVESLLIKQKTHEYKQFFEKFEIWMNDKSFCKETSEVLIVLLEKIEELDEEKLKRVYSIVNAFLLGRLSKQMILNTSMRNTIIDSINESKGEYVLKSLESTLAYYVEKYYPLNYSGK